MLLRLQNTIDSMHAQTMHQERTANNLANANTVGFRRERVFTEVLNERLTHERVPVSDRMLGQAADSRLGNFEKTNGPVDLALANPDAFFEVLDEATGALRYTRAGNFQVDNDGNVRTQEGFSLQTEGGGTLQIPPGTGRISMGPDGSILFDEVESGRLRLVSFPNPAQLQRANGATFLPGDQPPLEAENPGLKQGYIERSNVNPITEMTEMIQHFRIFEAQQKAIHTLDAVIGQVTSRTGRF